MSKKSDRSFYSKNGINSVIQGVADIIKEFNELGNKEIEVPTKNELYKLLKERDLIPSSILNDMISNINNDTNEMILLLKNNAML